MGTLLSLLTLILAPILGALLIAGFQVLGYRLALLLGWRRAPRPFFAILFLRGLVVVVAIGAIFAIIQTISTDRP